MTLKEIIKKIEFVASHQPAINMIVENDVFRLNESSDARYGVFAWTQGQHTVSADSSLMTFSFTLFYIDRLVEDKSNEIEVQSVGIQTLTNIIKALEMYDIVADSCNFQTFNQRFLDECAGVFASVSFSAPIDSVCEENYPDFNYNFSNDFLIW